MAMRMEERIEEYLELSRAAEPLHGVGGAPGEGMASGGHAGGVMVGVPQFFNVAHLNAVNEAYAGIEDVWLRGRMAMWNAQMRIAQGANDLEAMCLFLQLQLEGIAQVALKGLYVDGAQWSRDWSVEVIYESFEPIGDEGKTRKIRETKTTHFKEGEEVSLIPFHNFAFQLNPQSQPGRYMSVVDVPSEGTPFDGRKFNAMSWDRYLHEVTVEPIQGRGQSLKARLVSPVKSLRGILGRDETVWLTHHVFADAEVEPARVAKGRWAVAVESHIATGKSVKVEEMEKGRYKYRGHVKDFMISFDKNSIDKRTWRVYSDSNIWDTICAYEMSVRAYKDQETGEVRYMMDQDGVISCTTFRRSFKSGESYDVMGRFGRNFASIAVRFDMMMKAHDPDLELHWGSDTRRVLDKIREVRNLLAHGNLVKRKGRSSGLTIEDVASFWEEQVQPRMPYWVQHVEG